MNNFFLTSLVALCFSPLTSRANPHHMIECNNAQFDVDIGLQSIDTKTDEIVVTIFNNKDEGTSFHADAKINSLSSTLAAGQDLNAKLGGDQTAHLMVNGRAGELTYLGQTTKLDCK